MDALLMKDLKDKAFLIRSMTISEIASFGSGHIGGSMSIVELLSYLYYHSMPITKEQAEAAIEELRKREER